MRTLLIAMGLVALGSAFVLYGLSYETRRLEARVAAQERKAETARNDIAVLKADRAHLARPARIEPIARAQGLAPIEPKQYAEYGSQRSSSGSEAPAAGR